MDSYIRLNPYQIEKQCRDLIFRCIRKRKRDNLKFLNTILEDKKKSFFGKLYRKIFKKKLPTIRELFIYERKHNKKFPSQYAYKDLEKLHLLRRQCELAIDNRQKEIYISTDHARILYIYKTLMKK